jgi:toxin ParE1/3/4
MARAAESWLVQFSAAADLDIEEIHRWTEERFGAAQADAYATTISDAVAALSEGPAKPGVRERIDIESGLYTLHLSRFRRRARHLILFRTGRRAPRPVIDILRVLHDAMDLARHIPRAGSEEEEEP